MGTSLGIRLLPLRYMLRAGGRHRAGGATGAGEEQSGTDRFRDPADPGRCRGAHVGSFVSHRMAHPAPGAASPEERAGQLAGSPRRCPGKASLVSPLQPSLPSLHGIERIRELVDRLSLESSRRDVLLESLVEGVLAVDHQIWQCLFATQALSSALGLAVHPVAGEYPAGRPDSRSPGAQPAVRA